jgi:hypothetical protein
MAKRLQAHGKSYFTLVTTPGVQPTNNLAEQAIRFVVIDRCGPTTHRLAKKSCEPTTHRLLEGQTEPPLFAGNLSIPHALPDTGWLLPHA